MFASDKLSPSNRRAKRTEKKCHMMRSSLGAKTSLTLSSSTKPASSGKTYSTASEMSTPGSQSGKKWATRALSKRSETSQGQVQAFSK